MSVDAGAAVVLEVRWRPNGVPADVYAFLLDPDDRFPSEAHLLWAGRSVATDRSMVLRSEGEGAVLDRAQLQIDLDAVSADVARILCILAAHQANTTLERIGEVNLQLWDPTDGTDRILYDIPGAGSNKCLVLGDLRRMDGGWAFRPIGQGYTGHIHDLAVSFG
jgi:tellurium resistance protein TerD